MWSAVGRVETQVQDNCMCVIWAFPWAFVVDDKPVALKVQYGTGTSRLASKWTILPGHTSELYKFSMVYIITIKLIHASKVA